MVLFILIQVVLDIGTVNLKKKQLKIFSLEFAKYIVFSFLFFWGLMLVHYPSVYFDGNTLMWLSERKDLLSVLIVYLPDILLTVLLLVVFRSRYLGVLVLIIFALFVGAEKYVFHLFENKTSWNVGIDVEFLNSIATKVNYDGARDFFITYHNDFYFWFFILVFPLFIVLHVLYAREAFRPVSFRGGLTAFIVFLFLLGTYRSEKSAPYFYTPEVSIILYGADNIKNFILPVEKKRPYITVADLNNSDTPENIIFIMDESIRGDFISLNNPGDANILAVTPYLYSIRKKLVNFGDNYSFGNCSFTSNLFFHHGYLSPVNSADPNIFQYMKQAGYKIYFLDAQDRIARTGLTKKDRNFIDYYVSFYEKKKPERDFLALIKLKEVLKKNKEKKFIFIQKQGAHFPYEENYKKEDIVFSDSSHKEYVSYLNAIHKTVDLYWKELVENVLPGKDFVLFWISDHGVNVDPDINDNYIKITHCERGYDHYKELFNVPSVMFASDKKYYSGFKNLRNGYSIKHIFSTLLEMAGYNSKKVEKIYGPSYKKPEDKVPLYKYGDLGTKAIFLEDLELNETIKNSVYNKNKIL